jgi:VCBS repeat-containing protein
MCAPTTVNIHIAGKNDAPTATGTELFVDENGVLTAAFPGDDVDSDATSSTLNYAITAAPAAGILQVNGDGTFTFDTAGAFDYLAEGTSTVVSFTFVASDEHGAVSNPTTVNIHVAGKNDTAVVTAPVSDIVVNQNAAPTAIDLSGRVWDPDKGDSLKFVASSSNGKLVQTKVVGSQLTLTYLPNASGRTNVTVTAVDRWGASTAFSFSVYVRSPREQLEAVLARVKTLRDDGVFGKGEFNVLEKKLREGMKKIDSLRAKAGVNMVEAFVKQVNALIRSRRLSADTGADLIQLSRDLIASFGPKTAYTVVSRR